ncbi:PREDICTED: coiled-coil domain-containing protein 168-like [Bison bison bison]|uniref:Coiled-coil domain-containing protein 168-like n=1 Tax=Bison bison bison TaxID=43346 RepID=A0A6P3GDN9_BISBB|nr:PREDICTED: coiled-coil domain-containing protein 168-like [Bison bison bison]
MIRITKLPPPQAESPIVLTHNLTDPQGKTKGKVWEDKQEAGDAMQTETCASLSSSLHLDENTSIREEGMSMLPRSSFSPVNLQKSSSSEEVIHVESMASDTVISPRKEKYLPRNKKEDGVERRNFVSPKHQGKEMQESKDEPGMVLTKFSTLSPSLSALKLDKEVQVDDETLAHARSILQRVSSGGKLYTDTTSGDTPEDAQNLTKSTSSPFLPALKLDIEVQVNDEMLACRESALGRMSYAREVVHTETVSGNTMKDVQNLTKISTSSPPLPTLKLDKEVQVNDEMLAHTRSILRRISYPREIVHRDSLSSDITVQFSSVPKDGQNLTKFSASSPYHSAPKLDKEVQVNDEMLARGRSVLGRIAYAGETVHRDSISGDTMKDGQNLTKISALSPFLPTFKLDKEVQVDDEMLAHRRSVLARLSYAGERGHTDLISGDITKNGQNLTKFSASSPSLPAHKLDKEVQVDDEMLACGRSVLGRLSYAGEIAYADSISGDITKNDQNLTKFSVLSPSFSAHKLDKEVQVNDEMLAHGRSVLGRLSYAGETGHTDSISNDITKDGQNLTKFSASSPSLSAFKLDKEVQVNDEMLARSRSALERISYAGEIVHTETMSGNTMKDVQNLTKFSTSSSSLPTLKPDKEVQVDDEMLAHRTSALGRIPYAGEIVRRGSIHGDTTKNGQNLTKFSASSPYLSALKLDKEVQVNDEMLALRRPILGRIVYAEETAHTYSISDDITKDGQNLTKFSISSPSIHALKLDKEVQVDDEMLAHRRSVLGRISKAGQMIHTYSISDDSRKDVQNEEQPIPEKEDRDREKSVDRRGVTHTRYIILKSKKSPSSYTLHRSELYLNLGGTEQKKQETQGKPPGKVVRNIYLAAPPTKPKLDKGTQVDEGKLGIKKPSLLPQMISALSDAKKRTDTKGISGDVTKRKQCMSEKEKKLDVKNVDMRLRTHHKKSAISPIPDVLSTKKFVLNVIKEPGGKVHKDKDEPSMVLTRTFVSIPSAPLYLDLGSKTDKDTPEITGSSGSQQNLQETSDTQKTAIRESAAGEREIVKNAECSVPEDAIQQWTSNFVISVQQRREPLQVKSEGDVSQLLSNSQQEDFYVTGYGTIKSGKRLECFFAGSEAQQENYKPETLATILSFPMMDLTKIESLKKETEIMSNLNHKISPHVLVSLPRKLSKEIYATLGSPVGSEGFSASKQDVHHQQEALSQASPASTDLCKLDKPEEDRQNNGKTNEMSPPKVLAPQIKEPLEEINITESDALQNADQEIVMKKQVVLQSGSGQKTRVDSSLSLKIPLQHVKQRTSLEIDVRKQTTACPEIQMLPGIQMGMTEFDAQRGKKEQTLLGPDKESHNLEPLQKSVSSWTFPLQSGDVGGKNETDTGSTGNLEQKKLDMKEGILKIDTNIAVHLEEDKIEMHKLTIVNLEEETIKMDTSNTVNLNTASLKAEEPQIKTQVIAPMANRCPIKQKHKKEREVSSAKHNIQLQKMLQKHALDSFYAYIPLSPKLGGQKGRLTIADLKRELGPQYLNMKIRKHPIPQILGDTGRGTPGNRKKLEYNFNKSKKIALRRGDASEIFIRSLSIYTVSPSQTKDPVKSQTNLESVKRTRISEFQKKSPNTSETMKMDSSSIVKEENRNFTNTIPQDSQPFMVDKQQMHKLPNIKSEANLSREINKNLAPQTIERVVPDQDISRIIKEPDVLTIKQEKTPKPTETPTDCLIMSKDPKENVERIVKETDFLMVEQEEAPKPTETPTGCLIMSDPKENAERIIKEPDLLTVEQEKAPKPTETPTGSLIMSEDPKENVEKIGKQPDMLMIQQEKAPKPTETPTRSQIMSEDPKENVEKIVKELDLLMVEQEKAPKPIKKPRECLVMSEDTEESVEWIIEEPDSLMVEQEKAPKPTETATGCLIMSEDPKKNVERIVKEPDMFMIQQEKAPKPTETPTRSQIMSEEPKENVEKIVKELDLLMVEQEKAPKPIKKPRECLVMSEDTEESVEWIIEEPDSLMVEQEKAPKPTETPTECLIMSEDPKENVERIVKETDFLMVEQEEAPKPTETPTGCLIMSDPKENAERIIKEPDLLTVEQEEAPKPTETPTECLIMSKDPKKNVEKIVKEPDMLTIQQKKAPKLIETPTGSQILSEDPKENVEKIVKEPDFLKVGQEKAPKPIKIPTECVIMSEDPKENVERIVKEPDMLTIHQEKAPKPTETPTACLITSKGPKENVATIIKEPDLIMMEQGKAPKPTETPTGCLIMSTNVENVETHMKSTLNMNSSPPKVEEPQDETQLVDTTGCASPLDHRDQSERVQDTAMQKVQQLETSLGIVPIQPQAKGNERKTVGYSPSAGIMIPICEAIKNVLESQIKSMIQNNFFPKNLEKVKDNKPDDWKSQCFTRGPSTLSLMIHPELRPKPILENFTCKEKIKLTHHLESKAPEIRLNLIPEVVKQSFQRFSFYQKLAISKHNSWKLYPRPKQMFFLPLEGIDTIEFNLKHKYEKDSPSVDCMKSLIVNVSRGSEEAVNVRKLRRMKALESGAPSLTSAREKTLPHILQNCSVGEKNKLLVHFSKKTLEIQMKAFPRIVRESSTMASAQDGRKPVSKCVHSVVKVPKRKNRVLLLFEENSLHQIDLDLQYKYLRFLLGSPDARMFPKPIAFPKHSLKLQTIAICKKVDSSGESGGHSINTQPLEHIPFKKQSFHENSSSVRNFLAPTQVCAPDPDQHSTVQKDTTALSKLKSRVTPEKDKQCHVWFQETSTYESVDLKIQKKAQDAGGSHSIQNFEDFTDSQTDIENSGNSEESSAHDVLESEDCIFLDATPYLRQEAESILFELQKGIPVENLYKKKKVKMGLKPLYSEAFGSRHIRGHRQHSSIVTPHSYESHKSRTHRSSSSITPPSYESHRSRKYRSSSKMTPSSHEYHKSRKCGWSPKMQPPDLWCHSSLNIIEVPSVSSSISFNGEMLSQTTVSGKNYLVPLTESNIKLHLAKSQGRPHRHSESRDIRKAKLDFFRKNNMPWECDESYTKSKEKHTRRKNVRDYESERLDYFPSKYKSAAKPHQESISFHSEKKQTQPFFYACIPADSLEIIPHTIRWTIPPKTLRKRNFRVPLVAKISTSYGIWNSSKKLLGSLLESFSLLH